MKLFLRRRVIPLLIGAFFTPHFSFADLYWDADGSTAGNNTATGANLGGTGDWDDAGKWYNGSTETSWVGGSFGVFTGSSGSVTVNSPQSVGLLTFRTNGYTITGSSLTFAPALSIGVTTDSGVTATIASTIAGNERIVKRGAGKLVLAN